MATGRRSLFPITAVKIIGKLVSMDAFAARLRIWRKGFDWVPSAKKGLWEVRGRPQRRSRNHVRTSLAIPFKSAIQELNGGAEFPSRLIAFLQEYSPVRDADFRRLSRPSAVFGPPCAPCIR